MSPMAVMPASDMSSAQGQQTAAQTTAAQIGTAAEGVSPTSLQPASDMNSIQRQQVGAARATAQAVVQAVAQGVATAKTVVVAVQTTRDAHRTAADEMSPMAREPTSDMTSAQGEQVAAKVGIREYERQRIKYSTGGGKVTSQEGISNRDLHIDFDRLGRLDDANQHPGDVMIVEPQIPIAPGSLEIPNIRNLTNLERTQGKAFQSDPQCKFKDHALARTAVWTGSARRRMYWIWHQSQEPVGRSVGQKWRGIPQGRLSWRRCKPRQADAGVQGNPKVVTRETASPFDERSCCRLWTEPRHVATHSIGVHECRLLK
jgi:hypothetical protein